MKIKYGGFKLLLRMKIKYGGFKLPQIGSSNFLRVGNISWKKHPQVCLLMSVVISRPRTHQNAVTA